jgi:hypothetical protein
MENYKLYIYNIDFSSILPVYINNNDIVNKNIICYDKDRYIVSQYYAEIYFNNMLNRLPNITPILNDADIVYFPIYTFLLAWNQKYIYNNSHIVYTLTNLYSIIEEIAKKKKVFFVYSDVMWEDDRCFINFFNFNKNVYIVCYENIKDKYSNNQIPIPFITNIIADYKLYSIPFKNDKKNLISYVGRYRKELEMFKDKIVIVDTKKYQIVPDQWISYNIKELYIEIESIYLDSYFSLQPHGDKQTRRGFYHSLLLGCIPVVFKNNYEIYMNIFRDIVDINDICIILDMDCKNPLDILLKETMNIEKYHFNINKIKHLLLYDTNYCYLYDYILTKIFC